MFCPNCGKDCGNGKFCAECGTQVQQSAKTDAQQTEWKVGMACPHCGGTKLEGIYCAFCGSQLILEEYSAQTIDSNDYEGQLFEMNDSYTIPKRKFKGYGSYIKLDEDAFVVHNQVAFGKQIRIPYNQITEVLYVRPTNGLIFNGFLFVRWSENRNTPMPTGCARRCDKCSVIFGFLDDLIFYHIYCLLKSLALPTAQFRMELPKPKTQDLEILASMKQFDPYFEKYSPMRNRAAGALCCESSMNLSTATEVIDKVFDIRQQQLYYDEPSVAIRDLNRILMKNYFVDYK